MNDNEPQPKETIKLSDEFKKDIINRKKRPWLSITIVVTLGVVVFASLGIGTYQIFFTKSNTQQASSKSKIESKPTTNTSSQSETSSATAQTYTVQAGDTLSGIAAKYNTTSQALATANGIADPESILSIGQILKIPN
jgi:LysM repeat protein